MSEFISLYSGSSGNSSVVRCGERYLIVDMGKGVRTTGAALKELEQYRDDAGVLSRLGQILSLIHISEPTRP